MLNKKRQEFRHTIRIPGNCGTVFMAFCPVAEREWIEGWESDIIFSESGIAEKNCVFKTSQLNTPDAIWVCSIYDFGRQVEYVRVIPDHFVTVINILTEQTGEETACTVTFTHTALSDDGAQAMKLQFNEERFIEQIESWKTMVPIYVNNRR